MTEFRRREIFFTVVVVNCLCLCYFFTRNHSGECWREIEGEGERETALVGGCTSRRSLANMSYITNI